MNFMKRLAIAASPLLAIGFIYYLTQQWSSARIPQLSWAEKTLKEMTVEEKIGQLLIVPAYVSNPLKKLSRQTKKHIKSYHVGGLILFQYDPKKWKVEGTRETFAPQEVTAMLNEYQTLSRIPLLVGMDAEWGIAMALKGGIKFPRNMTLGALTELHEQLVYEIGKEIGRQCNALGIHINFAPVVDVNSNFRNPVIGNRSFGDNPAEVARKGALYVKGLQASGVLACAKHFPGHGDTTVDSHKDLPIEQHTLQQLHDVDLFPFKKLIEEGVDSIMIAHMHIPALNGEKKISACLSPHVVTNLLKNELGFKGLVVTDSFVMKAITHYFAPGQAELAAFKAGVDIIVMPKNVSRVVSVFKQALQSGDITEQELNERVVRILRVKEKLQLHLNKTVANVSLDEINTPQAQQLKKKAFAKSLVLYKDRDKQLPFDPQGLRKIGLVVVGGGAERLDLFVKASKHHGIHELFYLPLEASMQEVQEAFAMMKKYQDVIVCFLLKMNPYGVVRPLESPLAHFMDSMWAHKEEQQRMVAGFFTTPYVMQAFDHVCDTIILAHQKDSEAIEGFFDVVFGSLNADGKMPVEW